MKVEKLVLQYEQEEKVIRTGSLLPDFQFPDHWTATRVTTDCVYGTRVHVIRFTKDTTYFLHSRLFNTNFSQHDSFAEFNRTNLTKHLYIFQQ